MILSIGGTTSTTLQQPFPELSQRNKRRILSSGSKFRNSQRPISMDPQSSLSSSDKSNDKHANPILSSLSIINHSSSHNSRHNNNQENKKQPKKSMSATNLMKHAKTINSRPIINDSSDSFDQPVPEFSPPESSQTKYHRLSVKFLINPKTSHELRKELHKINEEYKNEQHSWKAEKRRLKMTKGTKQEDLDHTKRKLKESTEKYNKKIEKLNNLFQQQISIGNNSNNGNGNESRKDIGREIIITNGNNSYNNYI
ncbi:5699_t:CDS:2 [Entrophospora sp. SA101]|nr:5699_t:CDS:2 [Entrophospora sp. SA101]